MLENPLPDKSINSPKLATDSTESAKSTAHTIEQLVLQQPDIAHAAYSNTNSDFASGLLTRQI